MTEPRRCPATSKRTGEQCGQHLPPGATVCRWHGGGAPQVVAKTTERAVEQEVRLELTKLGVSIEVDAGEALLSMVWEAAGTVAYLRHLVQQLEEHDLYDLVDTSVGKNKAEPHVLIRMWNEERDRLANVAALAVRAGIDERRVRMAEATTEKLFGAVGAALDAAGLTPQQAEAFRVALAAHLRTL